MTANLNEALGNLELTWLFQPTVLMHRPAGGGPVTATIDWSDSLNSYRIGDEQDDRLDDQDFVHAYGAAVMDAIPKPTDLPVTPQALDAGVKALIAIQRTQAITDWVVANVPAAQISDSERIKLVRSLDAVIGNMPR